MKNCHQPAHARRTLRGLPAIAVLLALASSPLTSAAEKDARQFRIHIHDDGVYRVDHARLEASGLKGTVASDRLSLRNQGRVVPLMVDDGGDGRFGPGDALVFVGAHLRGANAHFHDFSPYNVYVLDTEAKGEPLRMTGIAAVPEDFSMRPPAELRARLHLEFDQLRLPLTGRAGDEEHETFWYWQQMNHLASVPTRIPIDLSGLLRDGESSTSLQLQFRGWSELPGVASLTMPDHAVDISVNGTAVGAGRWEGRNTHLIEIASIPDGIVRRDDNAIEIRVPSRTHDGDPVPLVDVVYLDWIKAEFPRDGRVSGSQERLFIPAAGNTGRLRLHPARSPDRSPAWIRVEIFGESGFAAAAAPEEPSAGELRNWAAPIPAGEQAVWVVPDGRFKAPPEIELDRRSNLVESVDQRDYFIISHASLADTVEPLVRFHQRRGTSTELVDVQDIYDEFNFGIKHPRAIRDFLSHARAHRKAPAASLVLLVGDASWYLKEPQHTTGQSPGAGFNARDLIPTWPIRSRDGPAASDNPFVMLDGDDLHPDMAIGRFPATRPADLKSMVDKTIAYMDDPAPGAWRSRLTLVSDSTQNLSARNARLAARAHERGLAADELLAGAADAGDRIQAGLRSAIDEGMLVLHFFGHGGRYMWQTAPSRNDAGHLFGMEDLDLLAPSGRLPIVLSMSCATGPFDHPAADSLAEKFLRIPDRGAVAVIAASARNSPSVLFTDLLLDGLFTADTLGEAFRAAKNERQHPDSVMLYNLLGDPALVPARPRSTVALEIAGRSPLNVQALMPFDDFEGHASVEWLRESGDPVKQHFSVSGVRIILTAPEVGSGSEYRRLNFYASEPESPRDASGTISLGEKD